MKYVLTLFLSLFVFGCSAATIQTNGSPIDKTRLSAIEPGSTTRQAVIEAFGQPTESTITSESEKIAYVYTEKKAPVFFGVIENRARATEEVTTLEFTLREGIVSSYKYKGIAK